MERRPKTANILELNTIKGLAVMAKIAGMLSSANKISLSSIITSDKNKGVAILIPLFLVKNFSSKI